MKLTFYLGIGLSIALLWAMWLLRDRLNKHGFEFIHWRTTPIRDLERAVVLGILAAVAAAWIFRSYGKTTTPKFATVWMATTFGPLLEEIFFRGYLFWGANALLRRWTSYHGWLAVILIAAAFALSHVGKPGITLAQIASILGSGLLYGWLRLDTDSTVPPVFAHMAYNAVIFLAAVL